MKHIFFLAMLFSYSLVSAQSTQVKGIIQDSIKNPLELATVIATQKSDAGMANYAVTNEKGEYTISLSPGDYFLTASYLGMKSSSVEISISEKEKVNDLNFTLLPDEDQLEGVEIIYKMPVVVRGDTIVYNTDFFVNGTERKLGDVLKKLPGIQVNDNGEIEVEGQRVSKVMIEGKDFFDGDSKLATKNIPADALSAVEILNNYNEIDQMRGLGNDQDNIAINIRLREDKKNFWFGELEVGLGDGGKTRHKESAKIFYYSPETSINFIGNSNNTGEVPFTFRDYFNFTGGFRNFNSSSGTSFNIRESNLGFLTTQNDRAYELQNKFGAANMSHKLSDKWDLSGFVIYNNNATDFVQSSLRNYIQTNTKEIKSSNNSQKNELGMAKFSSIFKPNKKFQMDYDLIAKISGQTEIGEALSVFSDGNRDVVNPITEKNENFPFSLNQNLNAYFTLNAKNIFAGYLRHLFQEEDPFYNASLQVQPFVDILPLDENQDFFDINQNKNLQTQKLDAKIDYYYVINDLSNINFSLGSILSRQKFNSSIFQVLENNETNYFEDPELNNDVVHGFRDIFFGAHYKLKSGIFTFTPGLSLHNYDVRSHQSGIITDDNSTILLPDINVIAEFKQRENLRFNYRMTADFYDINHYAEGYVFNNYNRLFQGNRNLENGLIHSLNLNYRNFNMFNFTNWNGGISYRKRINPIRNNTLIEQINQISTPINLALPDESLSVSGSFEKTFRKLKASLQSSISLDNLNSMVNNQLLESQSFTQNYQARLGTNFKNAPNVELGFSRNINEYSNGNIERTFFTDKPFANVEYNFLNKFSFTADYSYFNYYDRKGTIKNEYSFLNASLLYRKSDSKWEYGFSASNLLDVASINRDSFNEYYTTTEEYFVQPRILLLTLKYHL